MEVKDAKVTGKLVWDLLKKLMKDAEKLGGLEKLVNANGNEAKLKDMVKKGQLEEIPVEEAELKELKKMEYIKTFEVTFVKVFMA